MSERKPKRCALRRRLGTGWLAVVALLLNILLPPALFLGAPDTPTTTIGFCGAAHDGAGPGGPALPAGHQHCILCLVAGVAPAPAPPPQPAPPHVVVVAAVAVLPLCLAPRRVAFAVAQPRGPPVVV